MFGALNKQETLISLASDQSETAYLGGTSNTKRSLSYF